MIAVAVVAVLLVQLPLLLDFDIVARSDAGLVASEIAVPRLNWLRTVGILGGEALAAVLAWKLLFRRG